MFHWVSRPDFPSLSVVLPAGRDRYSLASFPSALTYPVIKERDVVNRFRNLKYRKALTYATLGAGYAFAAPVMSFVVPPLVLAVLALRDGQEQRILRKELVRRGRTEFAATPVRSLRSFGQRAWQMAVG